jgi:AcrR family transcriptional regulator
MPADRRGEGKRRQPLNNERILRAAVAMADDGGVASLSMRKLARSLGVEAMSLYHHVPNKDAILERMVERVFSEIELPQGDSWKADVTLRAKAIRRALLRHPWALELLGPWGDGPAAQALQNSLLGSLRGGGFTSKMAGQALTLVDAYVHGFVARELAPGPAGPPSELPALPDAPPLFHLAELMREQGDADHDADFGWGLELLVDGLEVRRFMATRRFR